MNAEEVAIYLKTHPEFFDRFAELLAGIEIPNPHGDSAVSLSERQMGVMRDKMRALEKKMSELITYGEINDAIAEKVHRLAVALVAADDLAGTVGILYNHLAGAFAVPHVAVRIWGVGSGGNLSATELSPVPDTLKALAGGMLQPYCGSASNQQALEWFGEHAHHIKSMAQVPLREHGQDGGVCFGLLVLASEEVQRFYPDMGVMYLERIGDLASAALLRVVD